MRYGARLLGLPEDHQVAMVLTFGYPESKESMHRGIEHAAGGAGA